MQTKSASRLQFQEVLRQEWVLLDLIRQQIITDAINNLFSVASSITVDDAGGLFKKSNIKTTGNGTVVVTVIGTGG